MEGMLERGWVTRRKGRRDLRVADPAAIETWLAE
jgi:hypothetical protein